MSERFLRQPGLARSERFESFEGVRRRFEFTLEPGLSINEAIARPLRAAGITAASLVLDGGTFAPFHYLMPALSTDGHHAAWYSDVFSPAGETQLENGNVTFGERDDAPFIHCHAIWTERDGKRGAGHVLPHETIISQPIRATAWGVEEVRMVSEPDEETAFTLFHPVASEKTITVNNGPRIVIARVGPNEDIVGALEAICRKHDFAAATLRGGVGSLIGARYADGSKVDDIATEVFVKQGFVSRQSTGTHVDIIMVDTRGNITRGQLLRGENPVCITFELCLEEA
ncbi:DNA-binding protein [Phyllobacterium sp. LjRoot231]|uniref:PCC domain-containing protein n=1 Tax=Phyllobacterium sp. LjRoot231 TaxID=3342289 RepID=UPI003ECEDBFF